MLQKYINLVMKLDAFLSIELKKTNTGTNFAYCTYQKQW